MSELTNKHLTSEDLMITVNEVNASCPKKYTIARKYKRRVLAFLQNMQSLADKEDLIPVDEVFKDTYKKYGKVGTLIRGCRVRDGLTQNELARKLNIRQAHISEMEHGKRVVGKNLAHKLAKVFNTDYRLFL